MRKCNMKPQSWRLNAELDFQQVHASKIMLQRNSFDIFAAAFSASAKRVISCIFVFFL